MVLYTVVRLFVMCFFFFKQKTAYDMRISDWSSDVCSSDLLQPARERRDRADITFEPVEDDREARREIIAQRDHVDRAIAEAIGLKILFLLTLDHPHPGGIGPAIFEKLLERLGAEQVGEIAGIIAADDMMLLGPEVGEEDRKSTRLNSSH